MTEIINNQRKIKLDWQILQTFAESLSEKVKETENKNFTVAFVSDRKMRELNKQFRGKNSTTDVLSFPFEPDEFFLSESSAVADGLTGTIENPNTISNASTDDLQPPAAAAGSDFSDFLGDIIISLEQAQKQARENDLDLETEIKQLILHGVLHLCGYDHETDGGEMNRRELKLRDKFAIN
jgi:probable rRNA maturation factor